MSNVIIKWAMALIGLMLACTAGAQWPEGNKVKGAYNGLDGPTYLKDIVWVDPRPGWRNTCWNEYDQRRGGYTGQVRCDEVIPRICGISNFLCGFGDDAQYCVNPDPTLSGSMLGTPQCMTYARPKVYQIDVTGYLQSQRPAQGSLIPVGNASCLYEQECYYVPFMPDNKSQQLVLRITALPDGTPLQLNGSPCQQRVNCMQLVTGKVFPTPDASGKIGDILTALQVVQADWRQMPGRAKAVSMGANGVLWAIADDRSVWRWNGSGWDRMPGAGDRLAVDPQGNAYVVSLTDSTLWRWNGGGWSQVGATTTKVRDVAISATDGRIYAINDRQEVLLWNGSLWVVQGGQGVRIAVDGQGLLLVATAGGELWRRDGAGTWYKVPMLPAGRYVLEVAAAGNNVYAVVGTSPGGTAGGEFARYENGNWILGTASRLGLVRWVAATPQAMPIAVSTGAAIWQYSMLVP